MSGLALYHSLANGLLSLLVIAGLLSRRRWGACWLLPLYLAIGLGLRIPVWLWPARFYHWDYWFFTDCLQVAARLALAVELAVRALRALPRGLARAQALQLLLLSGTLGALLAAPPGEADPYYAGSLAAAWCTYASAWVFVAFLVVVWYHQIPTEELHRDIALGFTLWALVAGLSPHFPGLPLLQVIASGLYSAVLIAWVWTAWAPDSPTALSRASLVRLRPWRA